ncbi:MAG: methyltransferase domain-containing protein [Chloroflexota bacterium]
MTNQTNQTVAAAPSFNPAGYKNKQRQQWNEVAAGWQQYWPFFENGARPMSKHLVELAQLQSGQQVLDIATGIGEPALTAARRVGPSGHVVATDQAQHMLDVAQERAVAAGLQNIAFHEADAEALNLPKDVFDAVLSRWGLMFLPNLSDTLVNIRQWLRPGGWLATAVWDTPSQVPLLTLPMRVIRQFIDVPPPPAGVPNPFSLANVASFEATLKEIGFVNVSHERITLTWEFDLAQQFVDMVRATASPILTLLAAHPADVQAEIWQAIAAEAERVFGTANGRIAIPSQAISVVGQRK